MLRAVKGMNDYFEEELVYWRALMDIATRALLNHGYGEIRTPILEPLELFARSVGESSDIVTKEMYVLSDKDGSQLALRPENTAAVVRAMIENNRLLPDTENKVFYFGPMFRRERPQKGRLRQFYQLGAEAFGSKEASLDVELISMLWNIFTDLKLTNIKLEINSLGDAKDREHYSSALRTFFSDKREELCADCQRRLLQNPLRILDCKNPNCQVLIEKAPVPLDYLSDEAKQHFEQVQAGLVSLSVPFSITTRMVRGLDYYTRTVFEISTSQGLGSQNAIAAGGRYDALVEELGGKATAAIGFSAGIERIILALQAGDEQAKIKGPDLALVFADEEGRKTSLFLAHKLRKLGLRIQISHLQRSVKSQMRSADKLMAASVIVIGSDEVKKNNATVKALQAEGQKAFALDDFDGIAEYARELSLG